MSTFRGAYQRKSIIGTEESIVNRFVIAVGNEEKATRIVYNLIKNGIPPLKLLSVDMKDGNMNELQVVCGFLEQLVGLDLASEGVTQIFVSRELARDINGGWPKYWALSGKNGQGEELDPRHTELWKLFYELLGPVNIHVVFKSYERFLPAEAKKGNTGVIDLKPHTSTEMKLLQVQFNNALELIEIKHKRNLGTVEVMDEEAI